MKEQQTRADLADAVKCVGLIGLIVAAMSTAGCTANAAPSGNGHVEVSELASASSTASSTVRPSISQEALDYFFEIALGSEYGSDEHVVTKWVQPVVTVHADGTISPAARQCLTQVIADFNALTEETDLQLSDDGPGAINVHFAPVSQFPSIDPHYEPVNYGFFWVNWLADHTITGANVLISTTGITDTERCHLIREELTQSTGLMRDSNSYPDSMFYGPWTTPTQYSPLDKELVALLYNGALRPGYDQQQVAAAVTTTP